MPDISPLTNAVLWALAITFGCWIVMQLLDAAPSFRDNRPPEGDRPLSDAPPPGSASRPH